jgi:hypothetical protein
LRGRRRGSGRGGGRIAASPTAAATCDQEHAARQERAPCFSWKPHICFSGKTALLRVLQRNVAAGGEYRASVRMPLPRLADAGDWDRKPRRRRQLCTDRPSRAGQVIDRSFQFSDGSAESEERLSVGFAMLTSTLRSASLRLNRSCAARRRPDRLPRKSARSDDLCLNVRNTVPRPPAAETLVQPGALQDQGGAARRSEIKKEERVVAGGEARAGDIRGGGLPRPGPGQGARPMKVPRGGRSPKKSSRRPMPQRPFAMPVPGSTSLRAPRRDRAR